MPSKKLPLSRFGTPETCPKCGMKGVRRSMTAPGGVHTGQQMVSIDHNPTLVTMMGTAFTIWGKSCFIEFVEVPPVKG